MLENFKKSLADWLFRINNIPINRTLSRGLLNYPTFILLTMMRENSHKVGSPGIDFGNAALPSTVNRQPSTVNRQKNIPQSQLLIPLMINLIMGGWGAPL